MTKKELLDSLKTKFHKVQKKPKLERTEDGINWYIIGVYHKQGNRMARKNIGFYVENEGRANEVAYWLNSDPTSSPPTAIPFSTKVTRYLKSQIKANTMIGAIVEEVSENPPCAVVKVYINQTNGVIEKRALVRPNPATKKLMHGFIV